MKHAVTSALLTILLSSSLTAQELMPVGNEFLVNQQIAGSQSYPHVASDENGGYVITWVHLNNTIMARRYGADHQPLTDEITVAPGSRSRVYYWSEGRYVITWTGNPTGLKVLNADNSLSEMYSMGGTDNIDMDIRGDEMVVAWSAGEHIRIRKWNLLTHAWIGDYVQASEAPSYYYNLPQVRWTSTGNIVAVYGNASGTRRIYRKTFNGNLLAQTPEEVVHQLFSGTIGVINISINALDQLLIYARFGVNGLDAFWGRVLDASGGQLMEVVGNMSAPYAYYHTDCELYDNGAVVLTNNYKTSLNDPEDYNVRVNCGIDFGSPNTGWQVASNTVSGPQRYPALAKLPNGGFVMVWNGNGFQGDADGVYARAFHAAGFPGLVATTPLPIVVDETGTTGQLGLRLGTQPTGSVVVDLAVSDPSEVSIGPFQLTFTPTNWSTPQTVTVTGLDDAEDDGDISLHITASMNAATADATYAAMPDQQYAVVNRDDDATFGLPATQTFCRNTGLASLAFTISNVGDPLFSPTATSSDQQVVADADITMLQTGATTYQIAIATLGDHTPGTADITVSVTDGSFTYSDAFTVVTQGEDPVITWEDMELVSTAAATYQWSLDGDPIAGATAQTWTPQVNGNYTVTITDANGCTATSAPFFFGSTGTGTMATAGIGVYPVPAHDRLFVSGAPAGSAYQLIDAQGRRVAQGLLQQAPQPIALDGVAPGFHVLVIAGANGMHRHPVVVQ